MLSKDVKQSERFSEPQERDWRESAFRDAERQRARMLEPFHAWVVQKRHSVEVDAMNTRLRLRESMPMVGQVLLEMGTPDGHAPNGRDDEENSLKVPALVWEFATSAATLFEAEEALRVLEVYYLDAAQRTSTETLQLDDRNAAQVRQLWDWYMDEVASDDDEVEGE